MNCIECLKRSGMKKCCGETKVLKREGMLGKGVGALKDGGL